MSTLINSFNLVWKSYFLEALRPIVRSNQQFDQVEFRVRVVTYHNSWTVGNRWQFRQNIADDEEHRATLAERPLPAVVPLSR